MSIKSSSSNSNSPITPSETAALKMPIYLFAGAFLQWLLTAASVRWLTVEPSLAGTFLATFALQTLWWWNIQQVKRTARWQDWLAWSLGAALGAVVGFLLTGGRNG